MPTTFILDPRVCWRACSLVTTIILTVLTASAQWVRTSGPYGGSVNALVMSGSTLYAGALGGVYRSTDSAKTWTIVGSGLEKSYVNSLVAEGAFVLAGTAEGVFMSTDAGDHWSVLSLPLPAEDQQITGLALNGDYLFIGTYNSGLFRYKFDGARWVVAGQYFSSDHDVRPTGVANSILFVSVGNEGPHREWRSTDNGETWQSCFSSGFLSMAGGGASVYAGARMYASVFLSADSGRTWSPLSPFPAYGEGGVFVTLVGPSIYASSDGAGLLRSSDGGLSWTVADSGLGHVTVNAMVGSGSHLFAASGGYFDQQHHAGIHVSTDSGKSWKAANNGLANARVLALASRGEFLYAGTGSWGAFRSADSGTSWISVDFGIDIAQVGSFAGGDSTFFAAGRNGILFSDDGGQQWQIVDTAGFSLHPYMMRYNGPLLMHGTNLLAGRRGWGGSPDGVYLSTDRGLDWTCVLDNLGVFALGAQDSVVFAGGQMRAQGGPSGLFWSTDGGAHWERTTAGLSPSGVVDEFAVHSGMLFAGGSGGVYRSTDHGVSWSASGTGLEGTTILCFVQSGGNLFAGADIHAGGGGVFRTTDNGATWLSMAESQTLNSVNALAVHGSHLYAGTSSGVWRRPLSEVVTSVGVATPEVPHAVSLPQNYPNPFNPATTIRFGLPQRSIVRLTVYNLLGQQVEELINGNQEAGYHEVRFDGSGLASGIYFYRMQVGNFVDTKSLLLLR